MSGTSAGRLGIAVVTFRRRHRLAGLLDALRAHTTTPFELVVADDGGEDGTVQLCRARGVRVVTGANRGVCWNKNRGLYALMAMGCDPLLLFEDDLRPVEDGWEREWIEAARLWHHVSFAHPKLDDQIIAGSGTAEDPFVNAKTTAQCTAVSAQALRTVGYLDSRFHGYGVGHVEWTYRFGRAGHGHREVTRSDGRVEGGWLYIRGGLEAEDAVSYRDNDQVRANRELFRRIRDEPMPRDPWSTAEEREAFLAEQAAAGIRSGGVAPVPPPQPELEPRDEPVVAAEADVTVHAARPKWDAADAFALEAMRPLGGGFAPWSTFSVRPLALMTLLNEIDFRDRRLILELGSGVSTLFMARLLSQAGADARIVSVDSDRSWNAYMRRMLGREGLLDRVALVDAPLVRWDPPAGLPPGDPELPLPMRWYDLGPIEAALGDGAVDLLFVDGPAGSKALNRLPALPALRSRLAADATIMLHGANRPAEAETLRRWSVLLELRFDVHQRMSLAIGRFGGGPTLLGG